MLKVADKPLFIPKEGVKNLLKFAIGFLKKIALIRYEEEGSCHYKLHYFWVWNKHF